MSTPGAAGQDHADFLETTPALDIDGRGARTITASGGLGADGFDVDGTGFDSVVVLRAPVEKSREGGVIQGATRSDGRIRTGRLAGLTMGAAIWTLSWPILVESLLTSTVGLVDTTLSAGISEAATDAIGAASYVMWFIQMIGMAVGVGATAMVSRSIGRGRQATADAVTAQSLLLAVGASAIVGVILVFAAPLVARVLHLSGDASSALIVYLRTTAIGVPLGGMLVSGIACCRGAGDAKRPLVVMIAVNVVNILVSWALSGVDLAHTSMDKSGELVRRVYLHNPFSFDYGILGVALGTVMAWFVGASLVGWWLWRGSAGVRLKRRRLSPDRTTLWRIVRIGAPNFFESTGMWFGNFLVIFIVGWMAAGAGVPGEGIKEGLLGAHIIAIRIEAFSFLPGFAMGMAAATLTGQYLGAGRPDLASKAMLRCAGIATIIMGSMGMLFILTPEPIVGLLSQQETHVRYAPTLLMITGFVQAPFALGLVMRTALRGAGDTSVVMWLTWISTYAIRLPLAWFLSGVSIPLWDGMVIPNPGPDWGLPGVWIGLCSELVVRAVLFGGRYVHGGWRTKRF